MSFDIEKLKKDDPECYKGLVEDYPIEGIDLEAFEKSEPDEYQALLDEFQIVKETKGSVSYTFKKGT